LVLIVVQVVVFCLLASVALVVCLRRWPLLAFLFGLVRFLFGCLPMVLAFPCFAIGLFASPLCGAALTFFAAAKKVSKESGLATASL
jgi:hypothetical protein